MRDALNEGRITLTEYDERLQQAFAAKTYGELDQVLADLPGVTPAQNSQLATTDARMTGTATAGASVDVAGPPAVAEPGSERGWMGIGVVG